ncbi:MAG: hypothetical protein Kow0042_28320 [Calditrichia bacterium]
MWHGRIKLILGIWLIISAFLSPLKSPLNMMVIGFVGAICCFNSYRIWQAIATGLVSLNLFLSGLHDLIRFEPQVLASSANFLISGVILGILGMWCLFTHTKDVEQELRKTMNLYSKS